MRYKSEARDNSLALFFLLRSKDIVPIFLNVTFPVNRESFVG